jgi:outer membrane receptor protein involved in Fe transport
VFPSVTVIERGNPNVLPEVADTLTFGAVLSLDKFQVTVDYYEIQIDDVIGTLSYDTVFEQCMSAQYNPTNTLSGNQYCAFIQRNQETGGVLRVSAPRANLGHYETSGVDVQFNWRRSIGEVNLGLNVLASFWNTYEIQDTPASKPIDIVGTNGAPGGAQFEYRTFTTSTTSRGRSAPRCGGVITPTSSTQTYRLDPNTPTHGSTRTTCLDFNGRFAFNERYEIRFGIDNVADKAAADVRQKYGRVPV